MAKEKEPNEEEAARGARLRALRDHLHLSQEDLAQRIGIGRTHLSRLESGHLKFTSAAAQEDYARAIGATVGDLLRYFRHGGEFPETFQNARPRGPADSIPERAEAVLLAKGKRGVTAEMLEHIQSRQMKPDQHLSVDDWVEEILKLVRAERDVARRFEAVMAEEPETQSAAEVAKAAAKSRPNR